MMNDNTDHTKKGPSLTENNTMNSRFNRHESLNDEDNKTKENSFSLNDSYISSFKEKFSTLVERIKKATSEELPEIEKSLLDLVHKKESEMEKETEPLRKTLKALKSCAKDE